MDYSIQITTKLHEIRSTIKNVSKVPYEKKVIGSDFYLTPECMCSISFKKNSSNLFVYICNKSDGKIKIQRKIVLFDCNYKKLHEQSGADVMSLDKNEDVDLIGIIQNRSRYDTLTHDTLIIDLSVTIKESPTREIINYFVTDIDPGSKLRNDLKMMLENPVNSDVSLQVGESRIPAHWSVLCSRSPYFKKMFDSEMLERVQNSITITDLSLCTLKTLVEFLYTAVFDEKDDIQKLYDLYYAADKYEVMDLRTICARKIMNNATSENACRILQLAHSHTDNGLKMEVIEFIQCQSEAVFKTEGWKKFKASEPLTADVFSFFCLKKN